MKHSKTWAVKISQGDWIYLLDFFAISTKKDNYYNFPFALVHAKSLLKRCPLYKKRICSQKLSSFVKTAEKST